MATWRDIPDTEIESDKFLTSPTLHTLRDNPVAIAQGDPAAPRIISGYQRQVFLPGTWQWQCPAHVTRVRVWMLAGGGAGGGGGGGSGSTGGDGGDTVAFGIRARGGKGGSGYTSSDVWSGGGAGLIEAGDIPAGAYELIVNSGEPANRMLGGDSGARRRTFGRNVIPEPQPATDGTYGAGGGGGYRVSSNGGTGGGGGAFVHGYINVNPGQVYTLQVGAGGSSVPVSGRSRGGRGGDGFLVIWW